MISILAFILSSVSWLDNVFVIRLSPWLRRITPFSFCIILHIIVTQPHPIIVNYSLVSVRILHTNSCIMPGRPVISSKKSFARKRLVPTQHENSHSSTFQFKPAILDHSKIIQKMTERSSLSVSTTASSVRLLYF